MKTSLVLQGETVFTEEWRSGSRSQAASKVLDKLCLAALFVQLAIPNPKLKTMHTANTEPWA